MAASLQRVLLGMGEFLVGLAAQRLPAEVRAERRREWAAELPVILGDPEVKPAAVRAVLGPRTPGRAVRFWVSAGAVAAATGQLVDTVAHDLGWGHPLLFTLTSNCGWVVCVACDGVAGVIVVRSARRTPRPDPGSLR